MTRQQLQISIYKEQNQALDAMGIEFPDFEGMTQEEKGQFIVARFPNDLLKELTEAERNEFHIGRSEEELLNACKSMYINIDLNREIPWRVSLGQESPS